jgi:hypothetical protein
MQSELAARPVVGGIRGRQRVETRADGKQRVSLWQHLFSLYRLFTRARDASLDVERVPAARQSEEARKHYLREQEFGS